MHPLKKIHFFKGCISQEKTVKKLKKNFFVFLKSTKIATKVTFHKNIYFIY